MRNIKTFKTFSKFIIFLLILSFSCTKVDDITDLNINKDPNQPTEASIGLLLPQAQLDLVNFVSGLNYDQLGFSGILSSSDAFGLSQDGYYGSWFYFYTRAGKDIDEILKAAKGTNNYPYLGVAQILKAYSFGILVDLFGTVPFKEAFQGNVATPNFQPKFDPGSEIYDSCLSLCDQAIVNLTATSSFTLKNDLFYNNSKSAWILLAKSLKIRLLLNARKIRPNASSELQTAFSGDYIKTPSQDFTFKYTSRVTPDQRHPWYTSAYGSTTNNFTYFLTQYMGDMLLRKDPRFNFYFKRQINKILDQNNSTEKGATPVRGAYFVLNEDFWNKAVASGVLNRNKKDSQYIAGFFGRIRGDISGVPDDAAYRTVPGCYPAAGLFDNRDDIIPTSIVLKGSGAGIQPLITSNIMRFWLVEAQLSYNFGTPRVTFEQAIRESINNVVTFGKSVDASAVLPDSNAINNYVNRSLAEYDAAPSNEAKLNYVLYEAWFANIANGYETYNALRRNGYPTRPLAPITNADRFPLRLPIPATEGDFNKNAPNPVPIYYSESIFWDKVKFKF